MTRKLILLMSLVSSAIAFGQQGETPPYDPAPPTDKLAAYTDPELAFTLKYPKEFVPRTAQDLQAVVEHGHRAIYGGDPKDDLKHAEAVRCMHPLFYATAGEGGVPVADDGSADSILVTDFDSSCVAKKAKGDAALTQIAGSVLNGPGEQPVVQQMWFVAGGDRRIHSGMAATRVFPKEGTGKSNSAAKTDGIILFVLASAFQQKDHWILITYLSGTAGTKHDAVQHMSVAFEDGRPVLLYPYLLKQASFVK